MVTTSPVSRVSQAPVIHRAKWIVTVCSPPVAEGAVLTHGERIVAVGAFSDIERKAPAGARVVDHGDSALMPALVNAHTHLELSAFKGLIDFPRRGFPDWLGALFPLRAALGEKTLYDGFSEGRRELFETGTALCGDVTNGVGLFETDPARPFPERRVFLELVGFNVHSVAEAMPKGIDPDRSGASFAPVAHSVYSVSAEIIAEAKARTLAFGLPFSIHAAEHPEEVEFLLSGTGFCREFLIQLDRWDPAWKPPELTPVEYLDSLGALDDKTLLVHCIHLNGSDWATVAARGCSVCFCPRSNDNLGVGMPDPEKALMLGVPACIGTDSLASNTDLDLFAEAAFMLDRCPGLHPARVIEMITANPSSALGRADDFGTLESGRNAAMLAVSIDSNVKKAQIAEALIQSGKKGAWKWVNPPATR